MRKTGRSEGVEKSRGKSRVHGLQKREYSQYSKIGGGRYRIHGECADSHIASLFQLKDAYIY